MPKDGGAVAVPSPAGWDDVEEGAAFAGVSADGPVRLVFQGVRDVAWGCGTAAPAATFGASPAPSSGVVWIVQEAGDAVGVRPKDARPPTSSRRLYRLPFGGELDLQPGRSVVELGGARPFVDTYPSGGVNLARDGAIGPTWPELAITEGEETLVLVLRRNGVDEVGWDVVRIAGRRGTVAGSIAVAYGGCDG